MGFGLLLGSYFLTFAFSLSQVYLFTDIIGGLWMIYAFHKLAQYNRYFWSAMFAASAFVLASFVGAVMMLVNSLVPGGFADILIDCIKAAFGAGIHLFMFLGIYGIASGAESTKLIKKAKRNMNLMGIYYFLFYGVLLTSPLYSSYVAYVSACVYLYWFICFILNLILLYNCFGILYDDELENKERKQSHIPIINAMYEKFDKLDEKKNQYRQESMKLAMEEAEKVHQNKKKKKKKK